jgi:DNA-binding MarR family transcriptional regulator
MHDKSVVALLSQLMQSGPIRATDLADRVGLDLSTISRHLRSLEGDGHVARKPDPDDGRATLLAITRSGQRVVRQAREQRTAMLAEALDDWSDADRTELIRLTRRLADSLETA